MFTVGGVLLNPGAGSNGTEGQYCPISDTNSFLMGMNVNFDNRWLNFGLLWVFCIFNIVAAVVLYWLVRVPKSRKVKRE
jgi:ATP-binding cassette subfamily G (WHITE) protein 2 (PDR)